MGYAGALKTQAMVLWPGPRFSVAVPGPAQPSFGVQRAAAARAAAAAVHAAKSFSPRAAQGKGMQGFGEQARGEPWLKGLKN